MPRRCLQERGIPWSPGLCAPLVPKEGDEERGEAQASLSRCCSLFVPLTLAAVAGERGGPGSHADGSLGLVHSSGTVRGSRGGWVRAPRSLDGLQPVIHPSHLTLDWAAAPSGSHPLVPPRLIAFSFFTLLPHSSPSAFSPCSLLRKSMGEFSLLSTGMKQPLGRAGG